MTDFDRIRGGLVPNYLCLSVDTSGSMNDHPAAPGPGYGEFKTWITNKYGDIIRPRDGSSDFINEQWVDEMRIQFQSILDE